MNAEVKEEDNYLEDAKNNANRNDSCCSGC